MDFSTIYKAHLLVQRRVGQDSQDPKPDPTPNNGHTAFRLVSIGFSVEILRRKQVSSTNRYCPHQFAVWRAERAHSARPTATWITPRSSLSSLDRTAFRFVSIGLSVEILRRKQVSSTNRDCPHQLALRRPGSPLDLLSPASIVQLFVSSQSDFPLRFYDENKSARRIETVRISSPHGELRGLIQLALRRPGSPLDLLSPVSIVQLFVSSRSDFPLRFYDENKSARRIETVRISSPCGELRDHTARPMASWTTPRASLSISIVQLFVSSQSDFPLRFYDENKSARRIETVRISSPCGELRGLIQLALRRPGSPLELPSPVSILAVWRTERAHSARTTATWITPRASLSSLVRTAFRFVLIGLSVEILRRKQVSSTNRDCPHQLAVWRTERAHSAGPTATWITPRASLSSLDRTAFRFVSIGLSFEILRRKQVSSTNRDCPHQLTVWRAERTHTARPLASWTTPRASLSSLHSADFCFVSILR
ncbi:hypothetical protein F2Q69_00035831 [Brassica cretica]|uniref:Uncharacterized protein n=1 Tax=Brassica cretica TaxID=69181 RepID=A0A8S9SRV4_BRACR|nr:hypothetical protein F2Q69_00035831 [Brassica cretica]